MLEQVPVKDMFDPQAIRVTLRLRFKLMLTVRVPDGVRVRPIWLISRP